MAEIPEIPISRLLLRPFHLDDAAVVAEYCGEWDLARTTANIPHPYEQPMAEQWISTHQPSFDQGNSLTLAITRTEDARLVGAVGLSLYSSNRLAELGYWVGKPHWNHGYATEAATAVIQFAFENLEVNRIQARHIASNPASGRVMEKAGMTFEGILRQSIFRWGEFEDAAIYSILRREFESGDRDPHDLG